jgi:streptogramin lyase
MKYVDAILLRFLRSAALAFVAPSIAACIGFATTGAFSDGAQAQTVAEFRTGITPNTRPEHITTGPDGNLWFTEGDGSTRGAIGRITPLGVVTEFTDGITYPGAPNGIALGPDGNLWFGEAYSGNRLGKITPDGVVTEFSNNISTSPQFMAAGSDGNMWFTEFATIIGRVTPAGVVTEFTNGISPNVFLDGITAGPDGNIWFTEGGAIARIGRITPAGVVTEFSVGITPDSNPIDITTGPDGNLWFTEYNGNRIGRITPAGIVTEFSAGITLNSQPGDITAGPDGNLWFTELNALRVARITPTGVVTEFGAGITNGPYGITNGPDGNVWFTEWESHAGIGRITVTGVPAAPVFQHAVSRKTHGAAGTFDLPLGSVATNPTTEPRAGPTQSIVFTFDKPITSAAAMVSEGTATAGALTFTGDDVVVDLNSVGNQQYVTVSLIGVASTDGGTGGSASMRIGFLLGDVNQNRVVSLADLVLVNGQLAKLVTSANFLKDVNANGTLTVGDIIMTNASLAKALPAP